MGKMLVLACAHRHTYISTYCIATRKKGAAYLAQLTVPAVDLEDRNVLFFILDNPKSHT